MTRDGGEPPSSSTEVNSGMKSLRKAIPQIGEKRNKRIEVDSKLGFWEFHQDGIPGRTCESCMSWEWSEGGESRGSNARGEKKEAINLSVM